MRAANLQVVWECACPAIGHFPCKRGRTLRVDWTRRFGEDFAFPDSDHLAFGRQRDVYGVRARRRARLSANPLARRLHAGAVLSLSGFLDEPTTGVDPISRIEFWNMLDCLRAEGITILVSTPYMDEASRCGRIALMCEGQCLTIDTPDAIRASYKGHLYAARSTEMFQLLTDIRAYPGIQSCYAFGNCHHLCVSSQKIEEEGEQTFLHALTVFLTKRGVCAIIRLYGGKKWTGKCWLSISERQAEER